MQRRRRVSDAHIDRQSQYHVVHDGEYVDRCARRCGPDVELSATGSAAGPEAIKGPFDGALAVPGMLREMRSAERHSADAHVIACFDDTGLHAARAPLERPVVGIGEAAMHMASLVGQSLSIVTTLSRSVPILEDNARRYGFSDRRRGVLASNIPVPALRDPASGAFDRISDHVASALALGAEAIVLGCAGMAEFARALEQAHDVPIVEGVAAWVNLVHAVSRCQLSTSHAGLWATPARMGFLDGV